MNTIDFRKMTDLEKCDHFIRKFEAIPEELWMAGDFTDGTRCCALGHCGERKDMPREGGWKWITEEGNALQFLLGMDDWIGDINDGHDHRYQQPTPKQRILAALSDIRAKLTVVKKSRFAEVE